MATITTRSGKGSALTHTELDNNFTNLNTDKVEASGDTITGNLDFNDNVKARFGAGQDLEIFHDGSNSRIKDTGTGGLYLQGSSFVSLTNAAATETYVYAAENGAVQLKFDNSTKLATTSSGIDVTGTVTADGSQIDGSGVNAVVNNTSTTNRGSILFQQNGVTRGLVQMRGTADAAFPNTMRVGTDSGSAADLLLMAAGSERARITSDGKTGIGTSSPSHHFVSSTGSSYAQIRLQSDDTDNAVQYMGLTFRQHDKDEEGYAGILGYADSDENRIAIGGSTGLFNAATVLQFFTAANHTTVTGSERMRISSNGNVGIGTTDPDAFVDNGLAVQKQVDEDVISTLFLGPSNSDRGFRFAHGEFSGVRHFYHIFNGTPSSTEGTYTQGAYGGTSVIKFDNSGHLDFYTTGQAVGGSSTTVTPSHALRITTAGHILVGKTSQDATETEGVELKDTGEIVGTVGGSTVAYFNRNTSDGEIVQFRKSNSAIGSIGSFAGDMTIGLGDHKLRFFDSSNAISPCLNAGTINDNTIDLGVTNSRFKDLYLSGGVFLGGTGAANKLDDYEEGTWTPVLSDGTNTNTIPSGSYTKVGNTVTVVIAGYNRDTSGLSGDIKITGLPFTSGGADQAVPLYYRDGGTAADAVCGYISSSSTEIIIRENRGSATAATNVSATAATTIFSTFTYRTG